MAQAARSRCLWDRLRGVQPSIAGCGALLAIMWSCGCACRGDCTRAATKAGDTTDLYWGQVRLSLLQASVQPGRVVLDVVMTAPSSMPLAYDTWELALVLARLSFRDERGETWEIRDVSPWGSSGGHPPDFILTGGISREAEWRGSVAVRGVLVPLTRGRTYSVLPSAFSVEPMSADVAGHFESPYLKDVPCTLSIPGHAHLRVVPRGWDVFEEPGCP